MQEQLKNVATEHVCCITVNESLGSFHNQEIGISECWAYVSDDCKCSVHT